MCLPVLGLYPTTGRLWLLAQVCNLHPSARGFRLKNIRLRSSTLRLPPRVTRRPAHRRRSAHTHPTGSRTRSTKVRRHIGWWKRHASRSGRHERHALRRRARTARRGWRERHPAWWGKWHAAWSAWEVEGWHAATAGCGRKKISLAHSITLHYDTYVQVVQVEVRQESLPVEERVACQPESPAAASHRSYPEACPLALALAGLHRRRRM